MNLIALDLELEQSYTNQQTPDSKLDHSKIIQVGWVVYNVQHDKPYILKEQRKYVNIHVPLSQFIKDLTHITDEEIASGGTLLEAYNALAADREEFNTARIVRQWGGGDMEHMQMELESETIMSELDRSNYKWEFGRSGFNVKHLYQAFGMANLMNTSGGLSKCMGRCGIVWKGRGKHDALIDAINTAYMYAYLESKLKEK